MGGGNNTASLSAGTTDIYFTGASSQYSETYNGSNTETVTNTVSGATETLTLSGNGSGMLVFADTSVAVSGTAPSTSNTYTVTNAQGSVSVTGGSGTNTANFQPSTVGPTDAWSIAENASGQVVVSGTSVGYTGTATLSGIQQLEMNGLTYALVSTPVAGGSTAIGTPASGLSGTIVADGSGNDALTFSGTGTSDWYIGAGNNTATLTAGTTELYFMGASSQYSESYSGTTLTVKNTASGATDAVTLAGGTGQLVFADGVTSMLASTPTGGGSATVGGAGTNYVTDGAGNDTLTFNGTGTSYWDMGAGTTSAALASGTTVLSFAAPESHFSFAYDGTDVLTITDTVSSDNIGAKTLTMTGGNGYIYFNGGGTVGLAGDAPANNWPSQAYGGTGNDTFFIIGGTYTLYGGAGTNTVCFTNGGLGVPDQHWTITQNAAGQIVMAANLPNSFSGSATLSQIQVVSFVGANYNLLSTVSGGSNFTIGASRSGTILLDTTGTNTVDFDNTGSTQYFSTTSYWHAGAGTTSATLAAAQTNIYLQGAASDYTESYNGTGQLVVTNTNSMDGTGTKTLTLAGGSGELVFGSGGNIAIGSSVSGTADTTQYGGGSGGQVLNGTSGNDMLYTGRGNAVNGDGGTDTYLFGTGDGSVTINNGVSTSNTAAGQVDFLGSLTDQNLWFVQSGTNLLVDVLGTTDQMTLKNFYASGDTYAQVSQFDAGSLKLDTQLATLVQAMATYSANHSAFNPQTANTTMPTDTTLQNAITAAWHS